MSELIKQNFKTWLSGKSGLRILPNACIDCLEKISSYAVSQKYSAVPFFDITDYKQFDAVKRKINFSRFYVIMHSKDIKNFNEAGALYAEYLRSIAPTGYVKHPKFGYGTITKTADNRHTIAFHGDDGGPRVIAVGFIGMQNITKEEYEAATGLNSPSEAAPQSVEAAAQPQVVKEQPPAQVTQPAPTVTQDPSAQVTPTSAQVTAPTEPKTPVDMPQPTADTTAQKAADSTKDNTQNTTADTSEKEVINYDKYIGEYKSWIRSNYHLSDRTSVSYGSLFKTLDQDLIGRQITPQSLFLVDVSELVALLDKIFYGNPYRLTNSQLTQLRIFYRFRTGKSYQVNKIINRMAAAQQADVQQTGRPVLQQSTPQAAQPQNPTPTKAEPQPKDEQPTQQPQPQQPDPNLLTINFTERGYYSFTTVKSVSFFGSQTVGKIEWRAAYKIILTKLYAFYPHKFDQLLRDNDAAGTRIKISRNSDDIHTPVKIAPNLFAEGNRSANDIVKCIKALLDFCEVDYKNVVIQYVREGSAPTVTQPAPAVTQDYPAQVTPWPAQTPTQETQTPQHMPQHMPQPTAEKTEEKQASTRQPAWDIYEAAILLDGYLKTTRGVSRQFVVVDISEKLRRMALNRGMQIDDTYRNFHGIDLQMRSIQAAYTQVEDSFHATNLFTETVNLYKNDRGKFDYILKEAYGMCKVNDPSAVITEQSAAPSSQSDGPTADTTAEIPDKQPRITDGEHIKITDFFSNSARVALFEKLFLYQKTTCKAIVLDVRPPIIGAKVEGEKLRFYVGSNGHIHFSHYIVDYMPYDKLFTENLFDEYCRIIEKNNDYFTQHPLKVKLRQTPPAVQYVPPAPPVTPTPPIVSQTATQTTAAPTQTPQTTQITPRPVQTTMPLPSDAKEVEDFILKADIDGTDYNEVCMQFNITNVAARAAVSACSRVVELKNKLYHEDAFCDWEEGADKLCSIMQKLMQRNNGYTTSTQLYDYASGEMFIFLNDNGINDERCVYELAQHLFEKNSYKGVKYSFAGKKHISARDTAITSIYDLICKFADDHDGVFTYNQLADYMVSVGRSTSNLNQHMQMYDNANFLFYDQNTYIYSKYMNIDDGWFDAVQTALKKLFDDMGDHVILSSINSFWFEKLPALPCGLKWNALLLQGVLRYYGARLKARTISAMDSQDMLTLQAMLVSQDSIIQNFCDAVISYFYDNNITKLQYTADELRQLLLDSGMIHGGELSGGGVYKALSGDGRFAWNAACDRVTVRVE